MRPVMSEGVMEYFLPRDEDLDKLPELYADPIDEETLDKMIAVVSHDPANPDLDQILPVRPLSNPKSHTADKPVECSLRAYTDIRSCYASKTGQRSPLDLPRGRRRQ